MEKTQLLDDVFKRDARSIFKKFNDVFKLHAYVFENNSYKHSSRFAPIEFVGVALLIKMYPDRSTGLLAGDISKMRESLRESRQELRSNTATFKAILEYIDKLEKIRGGQGVISRDERRRAEGDSGNDCDEKPREKKPRLVNGVAMPPFKPRGTPKSKHIPMPPTGSLNSSRRNSLAGGGANGGAKATGASISAPTFAPPTAPLAFREKERGRERQLQQQQLQHQEPLPMVPVAPMSRYSRNQDSNFKLRPTHFPNSGNARPSSPHYIGHRQAPSPHPSNFRAINTPNAPSPFLPDLDTTDAYPPHAPHNNPRKRPRRDDEQQLAEDLDLNNQNQNQNQNRGNKNVNAADVVTYDTRHASSGTGYRSNNANNNANNNNNHNHSGGGYRQYPTYHTRGGSGNAGPPYPQGRRVKQERNSGSRRDVNYGFD